MSNIRTSLYLLHTPGPWQMRDSSFGTKHIVGRARQFGKSVVVIIDVRDEEDYANALLITAAPSLLSALEEFGRHRPECAGMRGWERDCDCGYLDALSPGG